ncbi:glutamyl-tRNA reductase [Klugiella xanthotipulae]|uniref:Glutamyl-tRNA reductase n=1 Tax=Klugiella xanthotipulae TaxID=244735 RepID=A0A543I5Z2_9MICO|nr:glutamyl-tRNA reductase [Klugiella xanthotipulae]TQM65961.1 glutamyl-tRNA reductase [Klugiella xanthotipulae]
MLLCLSASHKNADFEILETLSGGVSGLSRRVSDEMSFIGGIVTVATCNRVEVYVDVDEPVTAAEAVTYEGVVERIAIEAGIDVARVRDAFDTYSDMDVAEHLFRVSSGLESLAMGEDEIAGQVRRALETARAEGTTSADLERLFQRASQTSRGIKSVAGVGEAQRSLARLALEMVESRVVDWRAVRVLLVGTGSYARVTLAALKERGVNDIAVYSASGRAHEFALKRDLEAIAHDGYASAVASADLVICCTTGDGFVLNADTVRQGRRRVGGHAPLFGASVDECPVSAAPVEVASSEQIIVDLGLPRNVNPDVTTVSGVELLDLETIRLHTPITALQASQKAEDLVSRAVKKFSRVSEEQNLAPAMVALREYFLDRADDEIERMRTRGDHSKETEHALRHLVSVLLHEPMVRARELARQGEGERYNDALNALFGLVVSAPVAAETYPQAENAG